jgi:SulP family sulfate permease
MSHRRYLFSLRIGFALREVFAEGYRRQDLFKDLIAGTTVGIIAVPLAMALAIAVGVPPQYGLYCAVIAGGIIALTGGSRYSISGPTAAFVVILHPLVVKYGFTGLLLASVMAGIMLVAMAYARWGRFIEYIPEAVTLGFTGGIAIVIVVLQIPDFTGLALPDLPEHFIGKMSAIAAHLHQLDISSTAIAIFTLGVMLLWPRLGTPIPAHLPALLLAGVMAVVLESMGFELDTIGSRFHYTLADGTEAGGIPPYLPSFEWPWRRTLEGEAPLELSLAMLSDLLPAAFAIAMLGAIESLLCAVVLDGMSGKRHSANSELLAQGLANIITPFFGGITATAAIARSATNFKAGAVSPIAAFTHALVVLASILFFARLLAYLPMSALAALLMVVAWNMSEAHKSLRLLRKSSVSDILVWLTCLSLTVFFDMVIAITAGVLLASMLFMKEIAGLTQVLDVTDKREIVHRPLPDNWKVFKINGPLFFAAADRVFAELAQHSQSLDGVILHMRYSSYLDAGGFSAIEKIVAHCEKQKIPLYFSAWQFQPLKTLAKASGESAKPLSASFPSLDEAVDYVLNKNNDNQTD